MIGKREVHLDNGHDIIYNPWAFTVLRAPVWNPSSWQRPWQFAQRQPVEFAQCRVVGEAVVFDELAVMFGCEEVFKL